MGKFNSVEPQNVREHNEDRTMFIMLRIIFMSTYDF